MDLLQLVAELDDLLDVESVPDYGPNGLQVEGTPIVNKVITAVSASRALFARALENGADAIWSITESWEQRPGPADRRILPRKGANARSKTGCP